MRVRFVVGSNANAAATQRAAAMACRAIRSRKSAMIGRTDDHRFRELLSGARCTPEKGYIADGTQRNECARADLMECGLLLLVERVQQYAHASVLLR